jgi:hypothetical protein
VFGPQKVTQVGLASSASTAAPSYNSPRVVATTDNRFLLSWIDVRLTASQETSAVYTAVYSTAGGGIQAPTAQATSNPGATLYMDPALAELTGERAVLAYSIFDQNAKTYSVAYTILKSNGSKLREIQVIQDSSLSITSRGGTSAGLATLSGQVAVRSWIQPACNHPGADRPISA